MLQNATYKKNRIIDIRPPQKRAETAFFSEGPKEEIDPYPAKPKKVRRRPSLLEKGVVTASIIAATLVSLGILGFADIKRSAEAAVPYIQSNLENARDALKELETGRAAYAFRGAKREIESLEAKVNRYGFGALSSALSEVIPAITGITEIFKTAGTLTGSLIAITNDIEAMSKNVIGWLTHQDGRILIEHLERVAQAIGVITESNLALKNQTASLGYAGGDGLLSANIPLYRAERLLKAISLWLEQPGLKHLAILFQNPSEMRPAGGFVGSYGDLALTKDGVQEITVWDVYDPDGQLDIYYAPPKELRTLTSRWGARDANWFFDFPVSAEKTLSLLEQSKIYREKGVTFEGAIAINIYVLRSILAVTGPLELPEYGLVIGEHNFLQEIQREVEAGADNKAGEPKRILKILAPKLMATIGELGEEGKRALLDKFQDHIAAKDIMVYMRDVEIEHYLRETNVGGALAALPQDTPGEYLAVASANIGGGKSDAFLTQHIRLSNKIDEDGRISNFLTVSRTHSGNKEKDAWYRKANTSYIKIFTPPESKLEFMKGGEAKKLPESPALSDSRYLVDADLSAIENTGVVLPHFNAEMRKESGRTVFGTWLSVPGGETKKLELHYTNPQRITLGKAPIPYRFTLDKQSGSMSSLDALFEAPPGYMWKETGTPIFNYVADTLPARVSIDLTLVEDPGGAAPQL